MKHFLQILILGLLLASQYSCGSQSQELPICDLVIQDSYFEDVIPLGALFDSAVRSGDIDVHENEYATGDYSSFSERLHNSGTFATQRIYFVKNDIVRGVMYVAEGSGTVLANEAKNVFSHFDSLYGEPTKLYSSQYDSSESINGWNERQPLEGGGRVYSKYTSKSWVVSRCMTVWLEASKYNEPEQYVISYGMSLTSSKTN